MVWLGLFGEFLATGAADGDEPDAGEDEDYGEGFERGEGVEAEGDADYGGNDGLDVVIHANERWSQVFLANHDADVGEVGGADNDVGYAEPFGRADGGPGG